MNKRLSILLIFMLIFQTMSSNFILPSPISAEGSGQSVFTGISFTNEDGKAINIDEVDGESAVHVHIDWSISHAEVEEGSTDSMFLPNELHMEEEQYGVLIYDETEVGTYQTATDGVLTVTFNEKIQDHADAEGSIIIQAKSPGDEKIPSEEKGSESGTDTSEEEDNAESANKETGGMEAETETADQEAAEDKAEHNLFAGDRDSQQITENIIDGIKLIRDDGTEYEEGDLLELDEDLRLELDWSLPNGHEYLAGDTFIFQLPEQLNIYNELTGDLDGFGTYHVTTDGEVTFTFGDRIENESVVKGTFWVDTELNEQTIKSTTEELAFTMNEDVIERFTIDIKPVNGQAIQKNGQPVGGSFNTEEIEWTVVVNTTRESLENAVVNDPILEGQELVVDSIDLKEAEVNLQGEVIEILDGEVSFSDESTEEELKLELGNTNKAYQLTFRTKMKEAEKDTEGWTTYQNTAYLNSDGKNQVQSGASVAVERPESLVKTSTAFNKTDRSVEWEVNANFTEKELSAGTEIVDEFTFTVGDEEVEDVFEISLDNIDVQQVDSFDNNGEADETQDAKDLFDISISGNNVTFTLREATNKAFVIKYKTAAKEGAYITDDGTISNIVGIDGKSATSSQDVVQQVGAKSNSGINYEDKTIDWTITVNGDSQNLNGFILTDDFSGTGQKLVDDSIEIVPEATDADINLNPEGIPDGEGFIIDFGDIDKPYTITYQTKFTYDFGGTDEKPNFTNGVHLSYTTADNNKYELDIGDSVDPNEETKSNGAKNSSVNNETKEITWMVDINYNQLNLDNAQLVDEIAVNQSLVDGSVKIYPTTITRDGEILVEENEVDKFEVDVTENEINIDFNNIDQSYRVVFVTKDKDGIYNSDEIYENTAQFKPREGETHNLSANATLSNQGEFLGKNGFHNIDEWTIDWELTVNQSKSSLTDVTVKDDLGDGTLQILLEDSIKVTKADSDDVLVEGEDYEVELNGNAFSVTFPGEITDTYTVTYSSYILADKTEHISNEAVIESVDEIITGTTESEETVEVRISTGGGSGEGTTAGLVLEKVETDTDRPLEDIAFTLIRTVGNQDIVVREGTTNEEGKIHWTGLQYGVYTLEEVIPDGYSGEETQEIKLSSDTPENIQTIKIENERQTGTAVIEKVDAVTGEKLEGAVFEITNLVTGQTYTLATDEEGTVSQDVPFGEYTVEEITAPNGYRITEEIDNITVDIDETTTIEVANEAITEVTGQKTWITDEGVILPPAITVELLANGEKADEAEVSVNTDWAYSFTNLDKYDDNGVEIEYTIEEVEVDGYVSQKDGFDLINIQTVDISGEKHWVEVDDQYRPDSIVVNVLAENEIQDTQAVEMNSEGEWTFTFTDLPKYDEAGNEIEYTIEEENVAGYTSAVEGYTITNTQETTELSGTKTWLDDNSEDRPEVITVQVKNGGTVVQEKEITANDDWNYTFTDLPKYDKEGNEITYTVDETEVDGYEKSIKGNDITNVRVGTTEVKVAKFWKDEDQNDRPESITINLLQNGNFYKEYEITNENAWELTITNLPQFDEEGKEYEYTVTENDVHGYAAEVDGYEITNTRTEVKTIEITKTWLDDGAEARPKSITVDLLQDGEVIATVEVTAADDWKYSFTDLPAFDENGVAYTYTIHEHDVEGYETAINGYDITNTRIPEEDVITPKPKDTPGNTDKKDIISGGKGDKDDRLPDTSTNIFNVILIGAGLLIIGLMLTLVYRNRRTV
ncbi:Cna B-type domain-containing protein [Virgibacillus sp. YIM 98842]|uniref:Cna B-type domain-containing protein n=1 Tax=Virgibacillus sp. YIM 98842 TaxID=2663533 RepID=UPI0013DC512E|nr:Cna B-type domain-containing protein [Virgibacillus sp. YIM 98842]